MDNDSKDSDDISTSSDKEKDKYNAEMPRDIGGSFNMSSQSHSQLSRHKAHQSMYDISPKQQQAMAQDMFAQMKQLKAHNEAMGYHGYSGYLHRHDSTRDTNTENDTTDIETENEMNMNMNMNVPTKNNIINQNNNNNIKYDSNMALNESEYTERELNQKQKNSKQHAYNKSSIILSETQGLKHKLEVVSSSINKIRHELQHNDQQNNENISNKQLNVLIMSFQNQLTEIQDQIEDAENDIESNIDVKFIKYQEEIKMNKQKIKTMKKEKKDKEKQLQINKEKEQQNIIELQRLQIEQLISTQSHTPSHHANDSPRMDQNQNNMNTQHQMNQSVYFPLDSSISQQNVLNNNKNRNRKNSRSNMSFKGSNNNNRVRRQSLTNTIPRIMDDTYIDESEDDDDDDEMNVQYIHNMNQNNQNTFIPGMTMTTNQMINQSPNYIEGGAAYQNYQTQRYNIQTQQQQQQQQPLLSDNAIKIIGGVVIVLAGLYVISKYFSNRSQRNNMPNAAMRRGPRIKYG